MEEAAPPGARKRRALLLRERVAVIEMYSARPRPNYETLARMFNCGRSQIKNILRQKGQILQEYERDPDSNRVRRNVPHILIALNIILDEWVKRSLCHEIQVTDKMILNKSLRIQKFLDYDEFEPTKSWLRSFKRRHGYYRIDITTIKMPTDKMKSLKLRDIFEDIKETIEPSVWYAVELKLNQKQDCNLDQDEPSNEYNWDISTDDFPSSESSETVILKDNSQALEYLKPLEEFALLTENFRAIGLISQLETIFRSKIRFSTERGTMETN